MQSSSTAQWVEVARLDDLWEGESIDIEVDGEHILLVHLPGGSIRAYQGICPHQEYLLIDSDFDWEQGILTCGGHHWQFRLSDGQGVNPSNCQLFSYDVKVDGDRILLAVPQDGRRRYNRCRE
ncbi:MAG: (2Fe-2S)-binding protein [Nitrospiraceae bacterium]